jgi:formylglycine-generating enzyme
MERPVKKRIFLSHASSDLDAVRALADDLQRAGLEVWLDEREIRVGDRISRRVEEGLDGADYLAIWLTRDAVESGWVETEWQSLFDDEVKSRTTKIFPLLAQDCKLPRFLSGKLFADFRNDYKQGLMDLLRAVGQQSWENKLGMKFTLILPGTFLMGTKEGEEGEENERPIHQAAINRPFYMGVYVVTQAQWKAVMETEPWKGMPKVREGDDYPATHVSWYDARKFLTRLGRMDGGDTYLLPNEEEWEYAARAGTTTKFSFGEDDRELEGYGWYRDNTIDGEEYAHQVGQKKANPWGLFDMHGNVWEWMDDWFHGSYAARPKLTPAEKVLRGGGWDYQAYGARSAFRNALPPNRSLNVIGIRLIRQPAP